jgi:F-type H+-transporting ATP synthase subunit e
MASTTVNVGLADSSRQFNNKDCFIKVVRYTALFGGVLYGLMHKRTLQAAHEQKREQQAHHNHEELVAKAKEAWGQKQSAKSGDGGEYSLPIKVNF